MAIITLAFQVLLGSSAQACFPQKQLQDSIPGFDLASFGKQAHKRVDVHAPSIQGSVPGCARKCAEVRGSARMCAAVRGSARKCAEVRGSARMCAGMCAEVRGSARKCAGQVRGSARKCAEVRGSARGKCAEVRGSARLWPHVAHCVTPAPIRKPGAAESRTEKSKSNFALVDPKCGKEAPRQNFQPPRPPKAKSPQGPPRFVYKWDFKYWSLS